MFKKNLNGHFRSPIQAFHQHHTSNTVKSSQMCSRSCHEKMIYLLSIKRNLLIGLASVLQCRLFRKIRESLGWQLLCNMSILSRAWLTDQVTGSRNPIWGSSIYLPNLDGGWGEAVKKRRFYQYCRKDLYFLF